jgi:fructose-bisphosphate aldolase class II
MGDLLADSVKKKYGVGAFACLDLVTAFSTIRAAEEKNVPLIMLCEVCRLPAERDLEIFFAAIKQMAEMARVPVATILDHGPDFESGMQAIHYGFSTVMYDGSALPIEENIRKTQKIVEASHACGVHVEAEVGHVGGEEGQSSDEGSAVDESAFTNPDDAAYFARETGVDALAVAIGTVHGVFKSEPRLDIRRLVEIRRRVGDLPLVLHGGSGLPVEQFHAAIENGINKINIYTNVAIGSANACRDIFAGRNSGTVVFDELIVASMEAIKRITKEHMEIFKTQSLCI